MEHRTHLAKVGLALMLLVSLLLLAACQPHPLERAREQVPIGITREEAIAILNQEAWYHQPCPNRITIDDLFFYTSRRFKKAQVVIVQSEPVEGEYRVYDIGTFDEPNAWRAAYRDCLQMDLFEP